jgi:FHS family glucose/mannose:H+ symporter-like MFS transporter
MGSLMFAVSSLSGFVASHFARFLLGRYDRKSILQWACVGMILTLVGLAFSPTFYIFLFFSVLFGLNAGIIGLVPNILVPLGASSDKKQQLISGLHAMYGISSLLAPLAVAGMGLISNSWRYTFLVVTIAPITLLLYSFHKIHTPHHKKPEYSADLKKENKKKNFKPQMYLAFMLSFAVASEVMISSRLALYMRRVWNYNLEVSSLYVTGFFISLLLSRLLFTGVKFKSSLYLQLSLCLIFTAILVIAGIIIHPLFLAVAGFSIAPFYPLAITLISSEFPHDLDTAVSYMMATDSLMLTLMHILVGKLSDSFGIGYAIYSIMAFLACSFVLVNSYRYVFKKQTL